MKIILHADMNSYFASVEQQANPFLRGKPVAICSRISRNACIIACSVEAKKIGIKTGFSLNEARELFPGIVALEVDPAKIRCTTKRIFAIFADYTSAIEAYSIDEAFLDLTGLVANFDEARELALIIKQRILAEVGDWLRCSIGISHTRWLAKFAGELQKPDGLTVLNKNDLPKIYADHPVDDAWGIADGWKACFLPLGIKTISDLLAYNPMELKRLFGVPGYIAWANVAGIDVERVKINDQNQPKSVGHSYVFHKRTAAPQEIAGIMMKLSEKIGRRLRGLKMEAKKINIGWGYADGSDWNSVHCYDPVYESYDIFKAAWQAFSASWGRQTVVSMAVTAQDLAPAIEQISIFSDRNRQRHISAALDAVNDRYGEYTVIRGQMWGTEKSAPDRVGFRKTVNPKWSGENVSIAPTE